MIKPIYASIQHEIIIKKYLDLVYTSIKDVCKDDKERYKDFKDIGKLIIEYHNNYRKGTNEGNYIDFLSIIPINYSCMISGFLAGYETDYNRKEVRMYRFLLSDYAFDVVEDLEHLKLEND